MKLKQLFCGLIGHKFSEWLPAINAKRDRRWCVICGFNQERRVI